MSKQYIKVHLIYPINGKLSFSGGAIITDTKVVLTDSDGKRRVFYSSNVAGITYLYDYQYQYRHKQSEKERAMFPVGVEGGD